MDGAIPEAITLRLLSSTSLDFFFQSERASEILCLGSLYIISYTLEMNPVEKWLRLIKNRASGR